MGAYQPDDSEGGSATDGVITNPGSIDKPIVTTPPDGDTIDGHDDAPLLNNMHPGWQQESCLNCHNDTTRNPDHNYTDVSLCYLCHGENGLPGFADNTSPVISGVSRMVTDKTCNIVWNTNEPCLARLVLRTLSGDRLEFPVSSEYITSHRHELSGLTPNTVYLYEIIVTDKSGNRTTSANFGELSFTTLVSTLTPGDGDSGGGSGGGVSGFFSDYVVTAIDEFNIEYRATFSEPIKEGIVYLFIGNDFNTPEDSHSLNPGITSVSNSFGDLSANTEYTIFIKVKDQAGRERESSKKSDTTDSI